MSFLLPRTLQLPATPKTACLLLLPAKTALLGRSISISTGSSRSNATTSGDRGALKISSTIFESLRTQSPPPSHNLSNKLIPTLWRYPTHNNSSPPDMRPIQAMRTNIKSPYIHNITLLRRHFTSTALFSESNKSKPPSHKFTSNVGPPSDPPLTPAPPESNLPSPTFPRLLDRLKARGTLSNYQEPPPMTNTQRLLRPFLFTITTLFLLHLYTLYWTPPTQKERLFPTIPQSATTVLTIISLNVGVWLLWKIPLPINWRILNKYFISVPALPTAFSMLGCTFSHQSFSHLFLNCFGLYVFGSTLCDYLGRANFLALYLGSGVFSSFASLAYHALTGRIYVTSLGASGAVCGILGAYAWLFPDRELTFVILPILTMKAANIAGLMAGLEVWGLLKGGRRLDHMAHLSGLISGACVVAMWWKKAKERGEWRIKKWHGEKLRRRNFN